MYRAETASQVTSSELCFRGIHINSVGRRTLLLHIYKSSWNNCRFSCDKLILSLQECNLKMLTNARRHKKQQPEGHKNGNSCSMLDVPLVVIEHIGSISQFDNFLIGPIKVQSDFFFFGWLSEGDALVDKALGDLIVEKYWSHWMDTTESLMWLDADVRWELKRCTCWDRWGVLMIYIIFITVHDLFSP